MSKVAKNFKIFQLFSLSYCFIAKIEKTSNNHQKTAIFFIVFGPILHIFEDFSNLIEKQWLKPKNSCSLKFFASFGTQLDHSSARLVDIYDVIWCTPTAPG